MNIDIEKKTGVMSDMITKTQRIKIFSNSEIVKLFFQFKNSVTIFCQYMAKMFDIETIEFC